MANQREGGISWTNQTWNPATGCSKVSEGCRNCYAERYSRRGIGDFSRKRYGFMWRDKKPRPFTEVRAHPDRLEAPLHWRKPRMVFVCSMGDLFHEAVPDEFIDEVFKTIIGAKQHTFQILTKRTQRMAEYMARFPWGNPPKNAWFLTSVEDQPTADSRIPWLLKIQGAAVLGVSCEPLLGSVKLPFLINGEIGYLKGNGKESGEPWFVVGDQLWSAFDVRAYGIDWLIVGGETGPGARPMHPDWARSLRDQCVAAGVPFHFKQWGEWAPNCLCKTKKPHKTIKRPEPGKPGCLFRCGKHNSGRQLDGKEWLQFPEAKA